MNSIFQTHEWEGFRLKAGYQKSYWVENILVLQKNLPLGRSMLYSPRVSKDQWSSVSDRFIEEIQRIGNENSSIFYRLELDSPESDSSLLRAHDLKKSFEEMQPEHSLILDISKTEEEILAQMKQKGRYNIKIAKKNDIAIEYSTDRGEILDQFYGLYSTMASRHGITHRNKNYFEKLIEFLGEKDYARCYIATVKENKTKIPVAGAIATFYNGAAIYLYGGSADNFRNLMAPYILHWQMILDAKEKNCKKYDFFGIAPTEDPKHPWAGVTRFKRQFGGEEEHILGSYDLLLKPIEYQIFKVAEKIRR